MFKGEAYRPTGYGIFCYDTSKKYYCCFDFYFGCGCGYIPFARTKY
ncbi:MAG: hypothetical protein LBJ00_03730 [Planctomycetaceae bacterium]|nr:hypothetical protein [Planctomycetaceae bacterium]